MIGNARRLAMAGRLDVIPSNYSAFCADFAAGRHRADIVLVQLAQARDGRLRGRYSAAIFSMAMARSLARWILTPLALSVTGKASTK